MFEAKPPRPDDASPLNGEAWESEALRELTWADLVSRLAASRGIRESFQTGEGVGESSFDAFSAQRIAAHHNDKLSINPEASAYRKEPSATPWQAENGSATGSNSGAARK
ncbi:MAG: hypothetical protein ABIT16_09310 [Croceibacterium sp.]